jgi:NAD(P)H-hydrate epimerase
MRAMPFIETLPNALYRADQVREFDRIAIQEFAIPGAELMERAGSRAFQLLRDVWPEVASVTIVCGAGNNAGDGYVVARLAKQQGLEVLLLSLTDPRKLKGDAAGMAERWRSAGGEIQPYGGLPKRTGVIVDAILGTGLERPVEGAWASAVDEINRHPAPVLAIDIPSGLNSDTGVRMGSAVSAQRTVCFIGLKQGMFTGEGPDCCGEIHFDALDIPAKTYASQILSARRIDWQQQGRLLEPRPRTGHKGHFGHVLVIGGDRGYSGAVRLAAEAAARSGAGLVSIATHGEHAASLNLGRPELMCRGVMNGDQVAAMIERASVIALGPGLGQGDWGREMFDSVIDCGLPLVVDADGLNLLAERPLKRRWILTPHPGEAARLLGGTVREIQLNRFEAVRGLQERYGGVVVLKGAGSLVYDGSARPPAVCSGGNPGMATGGSGDLLTGMIAGLLAQGFDLTEAAELGVALHAEAGDQAAKLGERGMLAGDILAEIRGLVN